MIKTYNANRLRAWIERRDINQASFAMRLGVTRAYICRLCSDRPPYPSRAMAHRIMVLTDGEVTPDAFFIGHEKHDQFPTLKQQLRLRESTNAW
jgi:transcriptional regulator with XRE-family HTH domain